MLLLDVPRMGRKKGPEALRWQKEFGLRLATIRRSCGMAAQIDLAEASGVDQSVISRLESGASGVGPMHLLLFADALGCSTDVLLGRDPLPSWMQVKADKS